MKVSRVQTLILSLISLSLPACDVAREEPRDEARKITVASVRRMDVTLTQQYVCQIHSLHRIDVRTPAEGYVAAIPIKEFQMVRRDDLLFQVGPPPDRDKPEPQKQDKLASIKAPFDGLVGRLLLQQGSYVQKSEALTTLSDNSAMSVYFNISEKRYLEYMAENDRNQQSPDLVLMLADHAKFPQAGKLVGIENQIHNETGDIAFRADFPNPDGLLRHGQSGTVLMSRLQKDAMVIPQRATVEVLDKRYVYAVDKDDVAHQREVVIQNETDDLFVVKDGVVEGDKIVLEGIRLIRDGDKVQYEDRRPKAVAGKLK